MFSASDMLHTTLGKDVIDLGLRNGLLCNDVHFHTPDRDIKGYDKSVCKMLCSLVLR